MQSAKQESWEMVQDICSKGFSTEGAAVKFYFHKDLEVLAGYKPKTKNALHC